jgi:hypothetical protein
MGFSLMDMRRWFCVLPNGSNQRWPITSNSTSAAFDRPPAFELLGGILTQDPKLIVEQSLELGYSELSISSLLEALVKKIPLTCRPIRSTNSFKKFS